MVRSIVFARLTCAGSYTRGVRPMSIDIVSPSFTGEIDVLFNAIVCGQIGLSEQESKVESAPTLLPLIANKFRSIRWRYSAVEDGDTNSITCAPIGHAAPKLSVGIRWQDLTCAGCHLNVTCVVS